LISFTILGSNADVLAWITYVRANDVAALALARASKGKANYTPEVRLEDFAAVFNAGGLDPSIARRVVSWLEQQKLYPGKRGTAKYTAGQLAVFDKIQKAVLAKQYVSVGSRMEVGRSSSGSGHSAGEAQSKGLAGPHVYAVLDFGFGDTPSRTTRPDGQLHWVKLANPWGDYGRKYVRQDGRLKAHEIEKGSPADTGQFWLELTDLTKRFDNVYVQS
jgi:hypothetical protein